MSDWRSTQQRREWAELRQIAVNLLSMLAGALVLTMPVWFILLGII